MLPGVGLLRKPRLSVFWQADTTEVALRRGARAV